MSSDLPPWPAPRATGPVEAVVSLPGSKSLTNRALLLAALADGPSLTFLDVANELRSSLGSLASRVPTAEAPGDELPPLTIHNHRAKAELGFRPRPARDTIVETAESLRDLGLL